MINTQTSAHVLIDLLGQQEEYEKEDLLPRDKGKFIEKLRKTIWAIDNLQQRAGIMVEGATQRIPSLLNNKINAEQKQLYDEMCRTELKQQRWSDGLVLYTSLLQDDIKCPMNGIFHILASAGSLCFLGLATRQPLRGGIDVAWGVELHENELYGAIVARAYKLESKVAQYPRIVVGEYMVDYLKTISETTEQDIFSQNNRDLSKICLEMLHEDIDGRYILHYLGDGFRRYVSQDQHQSLYDDASVFVFEEYSKHRRARNTKLAFRYANLIKYFEVHQP